jgi:hypothetical protein
VRPTRLVAGAALTAALALGALPGIAGSAGPTPASAIDPVAFQQVMVQAPTTAELAVAPLDAAFRAAGTLDASSTFVQPGNEPVRVVTARPRVNVPDPRGGSAQKPPRYKISGEASFYDNGTTAMRLPRGTTVVICGNSGCIERIVSDYGPTVWAGGGGRIVDLYRPDFFAVCGCASWSGVTRVTVSVY